MQPFHHQLNLKSNYLGGKKKFLVAMSNSVCRKRQTGSDSREAAFALSVGGHRVKVEQPSSPEIRIRDQNLQRADEALEFHFVEIAKSLGQNGNFDRGRIENFGDDVPLPGVGQGFESQLTLKLCESRVN